MVAFHISTERNKMQSFKDKNGRMWLVELSLHTVLKVKKMTGIDLLNPNYEAHLASIEQDMGNLFDICWIACEEQATKHNMTRDEFDALFSGDVASDAMEATLEAIGNFIPNKSLRKVYLKALQMSSQRMEKVSQKLTVKLDSMTDEDFGKLLGDTSEPQEPTQET